MFNLIFISTSTSKLSSPLIRTITMVFLLSLLLLYILHRADTEFIKKKNQIVSLPCIKSVNISHCSGNKFNPPMNPYELACPPLLNHFLPPHSALDTLTSLMSL